MTALTHDLRHAARYVAPTRPVPAVKARKGFFARLYDRIIEARMRQVEREVRMHSHLVPQDPLKRLGIKATYRDAGRLPFVK